jgi:hypothetical protein
LLSGGAEIFGDMPSREEPEAHKAEIFGDQLATAPDPPLKITSFISPVFQSSDDEFHHQTIIQYQYFRSLLH